MFDSQHHGTHALTAEGSSLRHPEQHEEYGRGDTNFRVLRQQADGECRRSHRQQRPDEHRRASGAVAEVAEDEGIQRSYDKGDPDGRERRQGSSGAICHGEEGAGEDECRSKGVTEETEVLTGRPHQAGEGDSADPGAIGLRCGCMCH
ncbi:hypothetical protein ACR820_02975 [Streptomyces netropsis]